MKPCQIIIAILFWVGFFYTIYTDINGRKARGPQGFIGVVSTIVLYFLYAIMYYKAGAFSLLLH
jgi:hypothetical protein